MSTTELEQNREMARRMDALLDAKSLVDDILKDRVLCEYTQAATTGVRGDVTYTVADQYLEHVIRVADWLMED
jgi:hypothetical protein